MSQNGEVFGGLSGSGASRVAGILSRGGDAAHRRDTAQERSRWKTAKKGSI
jgi:hypothetical protein